MPDRSFRLKRESSLLRIKSENLWDVVVIGGGATGLGTAVDAASRGYKTLLLEQADFAKGTSSRSTKLIHGGVRYLAQGNIQLVYEALRERGLLLKNAPHLVKRIPFIIPCYTRLSRLKYYLGMKLYDWLSGQFSLGPTKSLSTAQVKEAIPTISKEGLAGGVRYYDAQFDDARLAINLAQTGGEMGATLINYFRVSALLKNDTGAIAGVRAIDLEKRNEYRIPSKVVINATGIFADEVLHMDDPAAKKLIRPSQGIHLVVEKEFLNSVDALMVPRTTDKRVLFVIPWYDHYLVGTTDTPRDINELEPKALEEEINFLIRNVGDYVHPPPERKNILSIFAGMRPLAAPDERKMKSKTKELSRSHKLSISPSGLITIAGGKWTTYRKMAEDTIDAAIRVGGLTSSTCVTRELNIHGYEHATVNTHFAVYGSDRNELKQLMESNAGLGERLCDQLPFVKAEVIWAVRYEMARTVEDVLARRLRALFINARASILIAPAVAQLIAKELDHDMNWINNQISEFTEVANRYLPQ